MVFYLVLYGVKWRKCVVRYEKYVNYTSIKIQRPRPYGNVSALFMYILMVDFVFYLPDQKRIYLFWCRIRTTIRVSYFFDLPVCKCTLWRLTSEPTNLERKWLIPLTIDFSIRSRISFSSQTSINHAHAHTYTSPTCQFAEAIINKSLLNFGQ